MSNVPCKYFNPDVLRWARRTTGYSIAELSKLPNLKHLGEWEKGNNCPTYNQLEKLAEKYELPVALFFSPNVPADEKIDHSFRSDDEKHEELPSFAKLALHKAKVFQTRVYELTGGKNPAQELIIDNVRFANNDLKKCAEDARDFLGIDINQQKKWRSSCEALNHWRDAITKKGIFVLREYFFPKNQDIYSGFCLYDKKIPIIFINNYNYPNRQIFTLCHELAHLIIESSLGEKSSEHLCNTFASELLLPTPDFLKEAERFGNSFKGICELAQHYCVSRVAVLWKMYTNNLIDCKDRGDRSSVIENSPIPDQQNKNNDEESSLYAKKKTNFGKIYIDFVFDKHNKEEITLCEAAGYLSIKPIQFDELKEAYELDR